jgi:putative hemolysin
MMSSIAVSNSRLKRLEGRPLRLPFGIGSAKKLLEKVEYYAVASQFGMYTSAFLSGMLSLKFLQLLKIHPEFIQLVTSYSYSMLFTASFLVIFILAALTVVLVQLARALAYGKPELILQLFSIPLSIYGWILSPLVLVLKSMTRTLLKVFRLKSAAQRDIVVSAEELSEILDDSTEAGSIEEDEKELIEGVFNFSDKQVREVMTPRSDLIAVPVDIGLEELAETFKEHGFSRLVVTGEVLDDVRGLVIAKDLIPLITSKPEKFSILNYLRPVMSVPGDKTVNSVLRDFQKSGVQFAIVIDEHGGVDGIVTFEDLVEEIVGDIFDEYDIPAEEIEFQQIGSGDIIVDGSADINDLNYEYDFNLPEGEYDTIAGFLIHSLGRFPKVGEILEHEGIKIKVEELSQNRVTKLRILHNQAGGFTN